MVEKFQWFEKRSVRLLYALALVLVSIFIVNPYEYGLHDHWYMLAWIENLRQPELLAIDPVIAQRAYHYSIIYRLVAWLPWPVYLSFFGMYCLFLGAIFYLSMAIHRLFSPHLVYLAPVFLLIPWFTPGGTFTISSILLMRLSGLPFLLLAIYLWLRQKSFWAWLLVGVAFLFHPTTALYLAAFLGIHILMDPEKRKSGKEWLSILAFVVVSLPVFVAKFTAPDTGFPGFLADSYWLETIRIRSPHHAFPDAWQMKHLLGGAGLWAMLVLMAFATDSQRLRRFLWAVCVGALLIFGCGLLFTYVWPAYLGIQVQPFRVARLVMLLALLFLPVVWMRLKPGWAWLFQLLLAAIFLSVAYRQSKFLFFYCFTAMLPLWFAYYLPRFRRFAGIFLLIPAFVILDNYSPTSIQLKDKTPEGQTELYQWIKEETPPNSLWVTPSDMKFFRNRAQRSVLVAWFDGTFGYFDHRYNQAWRQRYEAVFGKLDIERKEPELKDWHQLEALAAPFHPEGIFVLKREPVQSELLELQWSGEGFYVYRYRPSS